MEIKGLSVAQKYADARPATEPDAATGALDAIKGAATISPPPWQRANRHPRHR